MSNKIIIQAFALVREATRRVLGLRHYDVQLIGGLVLNEGKIAEMKTGEGKTIVALLPTFLNALYGKGVHVITVNDYLARRDAEYVGRVHKFLGLTVGLIQEQMETVERQANYQCDVIYLTNNQLGFDYLRDNLAFTKDEIVQRPLFYCVVDEIDSVLIDEARTPLIISGSTNASTDKYYQSTKLAAVLEKNIHYLVDEKNQIVTFLEDGIQFCEQALNVPDLYNVEDPWIPYLLNSIKAKELFKLNTHYILNDNSEIIIVDEFTGRTMEGRRWGDGLHQAVEAKENVPIQDETQTLASITYQNLFLLYEKLAGMTGTAKTEELEFEKIYNLRTVQVPTNRTVKRKDFPDLIYKNQYLKWQAIAKECLEMNQIGRPVLVGTTTIEKSELLAALLSEYGVSYRLLNAKPENIESEAEIIAQAGCIKAVTISTNMAGRGTDITLGGNIEYLVMAKLKKFLKNLFATSRQRSLMEVEKDEILMHFVPFFKNIKEEWYKDQANFENLIKSLNDEVINNDPILVALQRLKEDFILTQQPLQKEKRDDVLKLGGLHVIGTERHESRRIDNQLRGRAGRQGDKGSSRFFLSLDDRLVRLFGGQKIGEIMESMGLQDETPMQSALLNQSLDSAQKKVENYYFDARKQLFEYDQALTMQRNGIYLERKKILSTESLRDWLLEYGERSLYDLIMASGNINDLILQQQFLIKKLQELLGFPYYLNLREVQENKINMEFFKQQFEISYALKELQSEIIKPGLLRELERAFLLQQVDKSWQQHLQKIDFLRDSIRWRAYGQRDPLTDYKKESYNLFVKMVSQIRHKVVFSILRSKLLIEGAL
uniref:preprotein translocase subunit SecA n=1 Tax=Ochrosphaera neapolitana TaxID=35137 RepID=UPI00286B4E59|nr:preprotein translocase subunit SecA [Ochrosphaera neapolitana]WKK50166.1 preprotein translocase subunit SecA [Ochrosphaera neapolitana]